MKRLRSTPLVLSGVLALFLGGCAESEFVASSVKSLSGSPGQSGQYKVGQPYQIAGVTYYPQVDYQYTETGIASWYGPKFHGNSTANGEIFDMNEISAAHRTLPMPSIVRVTNLENGRVLNVRVNDRGPFSRGRIIDLSRRAAQLLDFERQGTAKVRVEILARESMALADGKDGIQLASADQAPPPVAAPRMSVTSSQLAPPPGTRAAPPPSANHQVATTATAPKPAERTAAPMELVDGHVTRVVVTQRTDMFVQAGAFSQYVNAHRMKTLLSGVAPVQISQADDGASRIFRVRVGPVQTVDQADALLARVVASGVNEAHIVVD